MFLALGNRARGRFLDLGREKINLLRIGSHIRKRGLDVKNILVVGVYLTEQPNLIQNIVKELNSAQKYKVEQRWLGLGNTLSKGRVGSVTVGYTTQKTPKFQLINQLISQVNLELFEYVMVADDDIELPGKFIDRFLDALAVTNFSLSQPARTLDSYIDHPIVTQQLGVLGRQTLFVEIGPVTVFHRSCFKLVFPFDLTSPMGWGYENVWAEKLTANNLKLGIIDSLPVRHNLRKPVVNYSWEIADRQRTEFLLNEKHLSIQDCYRVIDVYPILKSP